MLELECFVLYCYCCCTALLEKHYVWFGKRRDILKLQKFDTLLPDIFVLLRCGINHLETDCFQMSDICYKILYNQ